MVCRRRSTGWCPRVFPGEGWPRRLSTEALQGKAQPAEPSKSRLGTACSSSRRDSLRMVERREGGVKGLIGPMALGIDLGGARPGLDGFPFADRRPAEIAHGAEAAGTDHGEERRAIGGTFVSFENHRPFS